MLLGEKASRTISSKMPQSLWGVAAIPLAWAGGYLRRAAPNIFSQLIKM